MRKTKGKGKSKITKSESSLHKLSLSGFPKDVSLDQIQSFLMPLWLLTGTREIQITDLKMHKRSASVVLQFPAQPLSKDQYKAFCNYLKDARFQGEYIVTVGPFKEPAPSNKKKHNTKKNTKLDSFTNAFWRFITLEKESFICDRDLVSIYFREFCSREDPSILEKAWKLRSKEGATIKTMRRHRLMKSSRADNYIVLATFCNPEDMAFPTKEQTDAKKEQLQSNLQDAKTNKNGIIVSEIADRITGSIGETETIQFEVEVTESRYILTGLQIRGPHASKFKVSTTLPLAIEEGASETVKITVAPQNIGVMRAKVILVFEGFVIARAIAMSCGHAEMNRVLQPVSPYKKARKKFKYIDRSQKTVGAPKQARPSSAENPFQNLPQFYVPPEINELITNDDYDFEMEQSGWKNSPFHDSAQGYGDYWKRLLWAEERQALRDIQVYDMDDVRLKKYGRNYLLRVPGLAEGRPSVLRGDLVLITFNNCTYKGRVVSIRQLEVELDLHSKFSNAYNPALDFLSVRFTFSRMTLRTSHKAVTSLAEKQMGALMLTPTKENVSSVMGAAMGANASQNFKLAPFANRDLNAEQQAAVQQIQNGRLRPLPTIIFGPPGTGKTTTVVEAIYQLGKKKKTILLVAPSNDAADILVDRLADYFPPTELRRILAYSRSIESLPSKIRPYASDLLDHTEQAREIRSAQIVVSTVNLAARFSYWGIPRGHFEVICVDEAGHATEPEVIAVASSLLAVEETEETPTVGQLILAGDPKQLGPISTSDICLKYGLSMSYMERLTERSIYQQDENGSYPDGLLTKLVRNYRSHAAILKLPNDMFYKDLQCCGDFMTTSNMVSWEHLPMQGFPIIFHAMAGENLREGNSPSWFNPEEAQQAVEYARLLIKETRPSLKPDEIGIITPYARQAQKIRLALKTQNMEDIKVGSVETFQGQERRVIIVSTVRAEREQVSSDIRFNLGFVANPKRFNVAITRAKALLIVIGSPSVLALDKENWLPFMTYCHEFGAWTGEDWDPSSANEDDNNETSEENAEAPSISDDDDDNIDAPSQAAQQLEGFIMINREE